VELIADVGISGHVAEHSAGIGRPTIREGEGKGGANKKTATKAVFVFAMVDRSGQAYRAALPAIRHEAQPAEAEDHHGPGGGLGNGSGDIGNREAITSATIGS
jgi:hypothetical protein